MVQTDETVLLDTFQSCIKSRDLAWGKCIHAYTVITRIKVPVFFLNIIIDMYGKCGSLEDACVVFNGIRKPDVVSWNVMISSHAKHGSPKDAIEIFRQMMSAGFLPENVTFLGLLDACATIGHLRLGAQVHVHLAFSGLKLDSTTTNALINMYSKCSSMVLAFQVFNKMDDPNVISWNTILSGYSVQREANKVLEVFKKMEQNAVEVDHVSYLSVLNACALLGDIELGKDVHARIKQEGIRFDLVLENALLNMYTKCGGIDIACEIFDHMLVRNVISWTVIISSYSNGGDIDKAFSSFGQMHCEGVHTNYVTVLSILGACGSTGELKRGKQIHTSIICSELEAVVHVGNALVDMYSKCGSLLDARRCFDNMRMHDAVTWNTILSSYAKHGGAKDVLELVRQMREEGFKVDSATLASVLSACSRAGLVVEGFICLSLIEEDDGLILNASHYACLVDLLARAGLLEAVDEFYKRIPDEPNLASWRTLLGACKIHGDSKRAKAVANALLDSHSRNAEIVETISNMHLFLGGD